MWTLRGTISRHGTISIITIFAERQETVYLVDVTTLQRNAFETVASNEFTLAKLLESKEFIKVFFDIRNDSDALFSLYNIRVDGIEDLQLMELASRNSDKECVDGLAKCVERDATIGYAEKRKWRENKDKGHKLFDLARGGDYSVFDRRLLLPEVEQYCIQDVALMPHLREIYRARLCDVWWMKIEAETRARIKLSQSTLYNGKGRHMALGPPEWRDWRLTGEE